MKKTILSVFFSILLFSQSSFVLAAETLSQSVTTDKMEKILPATLSNISDQRYIELLERVNQQTSLLWTPYNTFIAALGVLVAFGAIFSAVLIYWQSKDYREQRKSEVKAFFEEQEKLNKEARSNLLAQGRELDTQIKTTIDEIQTRIDGVEASTKTIEEQKLKELKEKIAKLMIQKESISSQVANLSGAVSVEYEDPDSLYSNSASVSAFGIKTPSWHRCSQCKFGFRLIQERFRLPQYSVLGTGGNVQCPKCGNVDSI